MASIPVVFQGVLTFSDIGVGGGPMPGGPGPSHPIAPGGQPPGFWGGVAPPHPDQGLPGQQPGIWPSPGHPSHPIAPGGQPPGYWGGVAPPHPDQGLPGQGGGGGGGQPSHPIVLPPVEPGGPPVQIWPSPGQPSHPIVQPPLPEPPQEGGGKPPPEEGGWGYHPEYGWGYFPEGTPGPK